MGCPTYKIETPHFRVIEGGARPSLQPSDPKREQGPLVVPIAVPKPIYREHQLNRLRSEQRDSRDIDHNWSYDGVGNWTETNHLSKDLANAVQVDALVVNGDNEYIQVKDVNDQLPEIFDGLTPIYDLRGQVSEMGRASEGERRRFIYDWANRLVEVHDVDSLHWVARYEYDALGRRVIKREYDSGDGTLIKTTRFVYDGSRVIEEYELSESGEQNLKTSYVHGEVVDEMVVRYEHDGEHVQEFFFLSDRSMNVQMLIDVVGEVVERYSYNAFGLRTVLQSSALVNNDFGFSGRRLDEETGLMYYRARYYSAEMGRFMSRDPLGYVDGLNMYAYVGNNPLNFVDPTGTVARNLINGVSQFLGFGYAMEPSAVKNRPDQITNEWLDTLTTDEMEYFFEHSIQDSDRISMRSRPKEVIEPSVDFELSRLAPPELERMRLAMPPRRITARDIVLPSSNRILPGMGSKPFTRHLSGYRSHLSVPSPLTNDMLGNYAWNLFLSANDQSVWSDIADTKLSSGLKWDVVANSVVTDKILERLKLGFMKKNPEYSFGAELNLANASWDDGINIGSSLTFRLSSKVKLNDTFSIGVGLRVGVPIKSIPAGGMEIIDYNQNLENLFDFDKTSVGFSVSLEMGVKGDKATLGARRQRIKLPMRVLTSFDKFAIQFNSARVGISDVDTVSLDNMFQQDIRYTLFEMKMNNTFQRSRDASIQLFLNKDLTPKVGRHITPIQLRNSITTPY